MHSKWHRWTTRDYLVRYFRIKSLYVEPNENRLNDVNAPGAYYAYISDPADGFELEVGYYETIEEAQHAVEAKYLELLQSDLASLVG